MSERDPVFAGQGRLGEPKGGTGTDSVVGAGKRELQRGLGAGILGIAGLSSLAFAQPVYDLLRRAPEFFAIRDLYMGDLLALVILLAAAPTLVLSTPAMATRFLRPAWTRFAVAAPIGLLAAVIALQAVRALPAAGATSIALAIGSATAWTYTRFRGVRSFALVLSLAALVVPAILVLDGRVRRSATAPSQAIPVELADSGARAPIVLVIFDEWSLTSILDAEGAIDRKRLPNLARLADRATWYPNATAASDATELAVPAMLTGQKAEPGRLPTLAEQPVNLFTILAPSHDIYAVEPLTSLCPSDVNVLAEQRPPFRDRFGLLISDLTVVWLNLTLPKIWAERLPEVTQAWGGFGQGRASAQPSSPFASAVQRVLHRLRNVDRAAEFRLFIDSINPPDRRPGFYFLHTLLPHRPWEYLPSGRNYRVTDNPVHGLDQGVWTTDKWPVLHNRKRYLLQVQFVDLLIGELIERLESLDLFDQTLVAITADHGVAFQPGRLRRHLDEDDPSGYQPLDLAGVPLIIKAPFQRQATIDDTVTSLVELAPRLLTLAGARPTATPRPRNGPRPSLVGYVVDLELPADRAPWRQARLAEQAALLGETNDPMAIGVVPSFHGRRTQELPRRRSEVGINLEAADLWDHVELDRNVLPAVVHGVFSGPEALLDRTVAVALNGVVAASIRPHQTADGAIRMAAMLPERLFRSGHNQIDIFLLPEPGSPLELEHLRRFVYELVRGEPGGDDDALKRQSRSSTDADVLRLPVQEQGPAGLIGFLENGHRSEAGIQGWAADLADPGGVREVVAFLEESQFWVGTTDSRREDVAERFGEDHLLSGFARKARSGASRDTAATLEAIRRRGIEAYAVSRRGVATRLEFFYAPLERENGAEVLPISDGRRLPVRQTGRSLDGAVDLVARHEKHTVIEGWAADLEQREPPRQIVVYRDGKFLIAYDATRNRPDLVEHYRDSRLLATGYRGTVPGTPEPATFAERHRVFALMLSGSAVELPVLSTGQEEH